MLAPSPQCLPSVTRGLIIPRTIVRPSKDRSAGTLCPLSFQATTRRDETIVLAQTHTHIHIYIDPQTFSFYVCGYDNTGAIQTARSLNAMTRTDSGENSNLRPRPTIYAASRNPLSSILTRKRVISHRLLSLPFYLPHLSQADTLTKFRFYILDFFIKL